MSDIQSPLECIESAALYYADARAELGAEVDALRSRIKAAQAEHRPELIARLDQAANARGALEVLLLGHAGLFEKPKTRQMHGIKVGFRKLPGKVEYADGEDRVIERIRELLRGKARTLIAVKESVRKDLLADLAAADLAAIGASIIDCGDEVVIKAIDSDLDKLLKGLVADEDFARDLLTAERVL